MSINLAIFPRTPPPPPRHLLRTLSSPAASPSQMENEEGGGNRGNEWRREAEIFLFYHLHSFPPPAAKPGEYLWRMCLRVNDSDGGGSLQKKDGRS